MDRLHARYPFLDGAKEGVREADVDLASVVAQERSPILSRAVERIEGAVYEGRVPDPIVDDRVELLSYPVARVLVSLVDDAVLTDRYALAEARRAFDLLGDELDPGPRLRSSGTERMTLGELLEEFGLGDAVDPRPEGYEIAVTAYLSLTAQLRESSWRLVNRGLADGMIPLRRSELERVLREAIRLRVAEDLPLEVPPSVADELDEDVQAIRASLANIEIPSDIETILPEAFPPCISGLYDRARSGQQLEPIERFTLVTFLCCIGATEDELRAVFRARDQQDFGAIAYQANHVHGETRSTAYPPPSCETLETHGICPGEEPCRSTGHPLTAYERGLEAVRSD